MSMHKNSRFCQPHFAFSALALAVGVTVVHPASALEKIDITQMNFNGIYKATGTIDLTSASGSFTSVDPFFSAHWTATVQTVFTSSGTWKGTSPQGTFSYQFSVNTAAGDVAAVATYFDWNTNLGIPVLTVFNCGAGNTGDACIGTSLPMATPPFAGQSPGFNGTAVSTSPNIQTATTIGKNVVIDVVSHIRGINPSLTLIPATLTISSPPSIGAATPNTTTGEITYQPAPGSECSTDSFKYSIDTTNPSNITATIQVDIGPTNALCAKNNLAVQPGSIDPSGSGRVTADQLFNAGIPSDPTVVAPCVGGCFDYIVSGMVQGGTAKLVFELTEPVPPVPRLRKWNGSNWGDFVENTNNAVATASKVNGVCPTGNYAPGLNPGDECLMITIEDGGPNDIDENANGIIIDPLGVGKELIPAADPPVESTFGGPPFGGGGAIGLASLFGLAGVGARRQKRKN